MDSHTEYNSHIDQPYGARYAATVGRFQEGFLADGVTDDIDVAFDRAVECARKFVSLFAQVAA